MNKMKLKIKVYSILTIIGIILLCIGINIDTKILSIIGISISMNGCVYMATIDE